MRQFRWYGRRHGLCARHRRHGSATTCPGRQGGDSCACSPAFEAWAFSPRDDRKIRWTLDSMAEAKRWRRQAVAVVGQRRLRAVKPMKLREAAQELIAGMRSGSVRNRSGDVYKPSVIRGYSQALERHVLADLGALRLGAISRSDVNQWLVTLREKPSCRAPVDLRVA